MMSILLRIAIILGLSMCVAIQSSAQDNAVEEVADTLAGVTLREVEVQYDNIVHRGNQDFVTITPAMRKNARNIGEVIGRLQGFHYNPISKEIKYLGESNIVYLVDSVKKDIGQIKQLGHQRFSKIEITYYPTGRYQGYDAVVNLKTKVNYQGYDFYVEEGGSLMPSGRNGRGKDFSNWDNDVMYNYMLNSWTVGVGGDYNWRRRGTSQYSTTDFINNGVKEEGIEQGRTSPNSQSLERNGNMTLTADYRIDRRNTVSASLEYKYVNSQDNVDSHFKKWSGNGDSFTYERLSSHEGIDMNCHFLGGLSYNGSSGLWSYSAVFNLLYGRAKTFSGNVRNDDFAVLDNRRQTGLSEVADIDVTRKTAGEKWKFNFNYYMVNNRNENYVLESGQKLYRSSQLINRASLTVNFVPNDRWFVDLAAGVQATRFSVDDGHTMEYRPRFNLELTHNFDRKNCVTLYLSSRLSGPEISDLSGYSHFTDSLIYSMANPDIRNTYFHNMNLIGKLWNRVYVRFKCGMMPRRITTIYSEGMGMRPDGIEGPYVVETLRNTSWYYWGFRLQGSNYSDNWMYGCILDLTKDYASYGGYKHNGVVWSGNAYFTYYRQAWGFAVSGL